MEFQYGVVHASSIECHGVDGWLSIDFGVGVRTRGWWWCVVFSRRLVRAKGYVLSGKEIL